MTTIIIYVAQNTNDKQEKIAQSGCFHKCSSLFERQLIWPLSALMSQEDEGLQPPFTAIIPGSRGATNCVVAARN